MSNSIKELIRVLKQKFPLRKLEEHLKTNNYVVALNDAEELNNLKTFLLKRDKYKKKATSIISDSLQKKLIVIQDVDLYEEFLEWLTMEEALYYTDKSFLSVVDNDVIYRLPNDKEIIINEERDLLASNGTTGFRTWEAALFLYYYLIKINPSLLDEMKINKALELGCGTGFLGIFLAIMKKDVFFKLTDGSNLVVAKCDENVVANKLDKNRVKVEELLWGDDDDLEKENNYDFVFGADVTFDSKYIPALVETIKNKLVSNGVCIISATIRNEQTISTLYHSIEKLGPAWKLEKIYALPSSFCAEISEDTKLHRDIFVKEFWFENLLADIHIYKISKVF
ncbi:hypothetical protein QEN19_002655 [Hanseniaspora menglaensis]